MRGVTKARDRRPELPQDNPQHFYYLALAFVCSRSFVSWRLSRSRIGRAWNAMREDEQVADAMGISTIRSTSCSRSRSAARSARSAARCSPSASGRSRRRASRSLVSITALAVVILGGLGSIPGVVVGALVLIGLPGLLREFEEYRLLIYGARPGRDHDPAPAGADPERPAQPGAAGGGASPRTSGREGVRRTRPSRRPAARQPRRERAARVSAPEHLLEVTDVAKHFGGLYALSGLDLRTSTRARSSRVIGPNGAGKSTMFNVDHGPVRARRRRHQVPGRQHRRAGRRTRSRSSASPARSRRCTCSPT